MFFNVIIRADESYPMLSDRIFESTREDIKSQFTNGGRPDLDALYKFPAILTKEFEPDCTDTLAQIGYLDSPSLDAMMSNPILRFPATLLFDKMILCGKWAGHRTCWMVVEGDPFRLLFGNGLLKATEQCKLEKIDENLIAVMMPFKHDPGIDPVFRVIEQSAVRAGKSARRVDQIKTPTDITEDVRNLICSAYAVVADITGMNLNVVYELGFSHGKNKQVILLKADGLGSLPFDLSHQRIIEYTATTDGLNAFERKLSEAIKSLS